MVANIYVIGAGNIGSRHVQLAPLQPHPISRKFLPDISIPFMTSSISSVPPGERNPSPHTVFNKN